MKTITIDLTKFLKFPTSDYISGRKRGQDARKTANLDMIDKTDDKVEILIPKQLIGINISFFLGMFAISIKKLKSEKFNEKYSFNYPNEDTKSLVKPDVNRGIKEALDERTPLDILFGTNK